MPQSKKKTEERLAWVRSIGGDGAEDGGSIFGTANDEEIASLPAEVSRRIQLVDVSLLDDNPYQHRHTYRNIESLAEKIRSMGFKGSLPVRPHPLQLEHYQLGYGHRRKRAAQLAGVPVPIEIVELTDEDMIKLALSENLEREDLSELEKGEFFLQMNREFQMSLQDIADFIGEGKNEDISRGYVRNRVTTAKLAEQFSFVRSWLEANPKASLRAISNLEGLGEQALHFILDGMSQKDWTADTVEKVARTLKAGGEQAAALLGSVESVEAGSAASLPSPVEEAAPIRTIVSLAAPAPNATRGSTLPVQTAPVTHLPEEKNAAAVPGESPERETTPVSTDASTYPQERVAPAGAAAPPKTGGQNGQQQENKGVEVLQRLALVQDLEKRAQRYAARLGNAKLSKEEKQVWQRLVQLGQRLAERE